RRHHRLAVRRATRPPPSRVRQGHSGQPPDGRDGRPLPAAAHVAADAEGPAQRAHVPAAHRGGAGARPGRGGGGDGGERHGDCAGVFQVAGRAIATPRASVAVPAGDRITSAPWPVPTGSFPASIRGAGPGWTRTSLLAWAPRGRVSVGQRAILAQVSRRSASLAL